MLTKSYLFNLTIMTTENNKSSVSAQRALCEASQLGGEQLH